MTEWILILYIYAGALAHGDSVALDHVPGFFTQKECQEAGELSKQLVSLTTKAMRYVCVKQSEHPQ